MALRQEFDIDRFIIRNGIALIIVNKLFRSRVRNSSWLPDRPGAQHDKTKIRTFCTNIGCIYQIHDDLTAEGMIEVCKRFSQTNFSMYDAVLCFISSHGDEGDVIYGTDGNRVTVNDVVSKFIGKVSLANKPKLFFMQNCRGRYTDGGVDMVHADRPRTTPFRIPFEADMLVSFSTVDGYESYRDVTQGSWFISKLMEVLNERDHDLSLTELLCIVNKRVSRMDYYGRKQMSCFRTTLRKPVYFEFRVMNRESEQGIRRNSTPQQL